MQEKHVDQFLDRLHQDLESNQLVLPTLPEVALRVRDILENPESSLAAAVKVIGRDAALSARLIQVANSPLLRATRNIESIETAVMRLGSKMVRNVVVNMAMEQMFQATSPIVDRKLRATWRHSTEVATIAYTLCQEFTNLKPDQAMLAGLIHDIGILPILSRAEDSPELLRDESALDSVIARAHSTVGGAILRQWDFQEELIWVVLEHENYNYKAGKSPDYVDVVIVADLQSSGIDSAEPIEIDWSSIPSFEKLGLASQPDVVNFDASCFGIPA